MNVDKARQQLKELEDYIEILENYQTKTFEQECTYLYVQMESVSKVAGELNKKGYKVGNRKVISKDVSDVIRSKPADEMHVMAKKFFNGNKKRASGRGWL